MTVKISGYGNVTQAALASFEKAFGKLPETYRQFLSTHNGGELSSNIHVSGLCSVRILYGIGIPDAGIASINEAYRSRIPINTLAIGEDSSGNLICLGLRGTVVGRVFFWDHEEEAEVGEEASFRNMTELAPTFDEFLEQLADPASFEEGPLPAGVEVWVSPELKRRLNGDP